MVAWNTACPDWEERILSGRSLVPDLPLFQDEAERALRIFKRLRIPDVIGKPTMGEAAGDWFFPIVAALFGAYDAEAKIRMIQEFFLLVPKKNGKSSSAAAIIVVAIIMNRRPEAEFLLISKTKKLADIAFKQAKGIINADPELKKLFKIQQHIRTITHLVSNATILIQAADTEVITGSKSTGILIDEVHEFAKMSKAPDIFLEIRGALNARPDGFMIQISTQSKEPPAGVFETELGTARDVRDGILVLPNPMLAVIYELPLRMQVGEEWKDRKNWPLINPNWLKSVNPAFLETEWIKAERGGMAAMALFASQFLNVQIGIKLRGNRWPGAEHWEKNAAPLLTLNEVIAQSEVIVVGLDGGGLDDLFGLAVLGRAKHSDRWLLWSHAWCHKGVLDRRKSIAAKLLELKTAEELTIVEDDLDDIPQIIAIIDRIKKAGLLGGVAVDPAGLGEMVEALSEIGLTVEEKQVLGAPQGFGMMNAIKTCERKLARGLLAHGGTRLMDWCTSNIKIEPTATAIRATKQNAGDLKIDPAMALFDAAVVMITNPEAMSVGAGRAFVL